MRFFVIDRGAPRARDVDYPYVVLERDRWDDFGLRTLFRAELRLGRNWTVDLREVKILQRNQTSGRTPIDEEFSALDDTYCSLGQELSYYESLVELPEHVKDEYLIALRDVAKYPDILRTFENEPGFGASLIRWGPAQRALEDAQSVFLGELENRLGLEFTFHTKFSSDSNEFATKFNFFSVEDLPGRLNAVIGYNGTGKTRLLANLAWVAQADLESREKNHTIASFGRLEPADFRFGGVIAISYSAFDTFELPKNSDDRKDFGYTYCGLRRDDEQGGTSGLKDAGQIVDEIASAMVRINTQERRDALAAALEPLRAEPSFKRAGYEIDILGDEKSWRAEFARLSSGHKISVNIIVQLVSALQQRSLVLIDEPESHLHPPLLAALMKAIYIALETRRSYGVIATHSPVVLQEIAGCYAHVLRRHGDQNFVAEPQIETFGENVGLLTRHVFNLDNSQSDYVGILRDLASQRALEKIEELFPRGLSSEARVLIMKEKRK